ncbi:hypothetical protein [Kineococcus rhizosphaerae]|uniref:AAA domain-containing protein n=1 Tax=Kineococcus rhizosphaerae TaxID=559628 RepID=A0A2T0R0X8_9ACTN|nr:hypothetical protein [Kineococcus rhizosphaerae]PRY12974.1 hypothetical protein CLV37_109161 [Kineococcus rhizosphaerae]
MTSSAATGPDSTRRRWWAEAQALGGTSALLDCPVGTDAVLDLTTAHPSGLAQLLAGGPAPLSSLVRESGAFTEARRRARTTHRLAGALLAQRGTRSLAVAVGTAGWSLAEEADARELAEAVLPSTLRAPRRTPVLLRRCTLTPATEALDDFVVQLAPEVIVNPVLVRVVRSELGVDLDTRRIATAVGAHWGFDPNPAMDELRRQLTGVRGLRVERRLLLGTFADPGADLLADLRRRGALAREHRVVAAIAEQRAVAAPPPLAGDERVPPAAEGFCLDPAQRQAVEAVLAGHDLRLHAPTGTGATQVAAAVVASEVAAGRRVLLVADSAADRRAVDERLRDNGFGRLLLHLVADLDDSADDAGLQRAAARRELEARCLTDRTPGADPDVGGPATVLDEHARALHRLREPWAVSAAEAVEALLTLAERPQPPTTSRRLRGQALTACSREDLAHWQDAVVEAVELGAFTVGPGTTPWAGAALRTPEAAARALGRVEDLLGQRLPALRALLATVCDAAGLRGAASVAEAVDRTDLLAGVRATVDRFGPEVFAQSLGDVAAATATAQWRREHEVRQGWVRRWRLRREARALLRPEVSAEDLPTLHDWLQAARSQRLRWQRVSVRDNAPRVPDDLDALAAAVDAVRHELTELALVLPERTWTGLGAASLLEVQLPELTTLLRALAADAAALEPLPRRTVLLEELEAAGWDGLLEDLRARWTGPGSLHLPSEVEAAWWSGVLDAVSMVDPLVGTGEAAALRSARHELQLAVAARRRVRAAAVRADLDARARTSDADLLPVTALSTAGVAALAERVEDADLLVVLGAQATTTSSALPALSRGVRVLVVGDPDLPGPADVATARDEQSPSRPVAQSLFADVGAVLPTLRLDRQHALLDDTLLSAVPVPVAETSLPGPGRDGRATARTSDRPPGARRGPDALVDLVLDTALAALRAHPEESLGIVVPDAAGAELLADTVRRQALEEELPLAVGREPLLVGTPVRWTGERRDHVLVVTDAVLNGPALGAAGEGGDGVPTGRAEAWMALTRSRLRTTLVLDDSGWSAGRTGEDDLADGRDLLARTAVAWERDELLAEEPGGSAPDRPGADAVVRALAAACRRVGLPVECEVGASHRLALVVRDERARAGVGPALAVELDDAAWAAGDVVDREVDGPTELERRGWRYVRVLTADVFADADAEAGRLAALWRDTLADAGHELPWVVDLDRAGPAEPADGAVDVRDEDRTPVPAEADAS